MDKTPRRWLPVAYGAGLALITIALGVIAYHAMFSYFDVPDDDGYLLMSLRKFDAGGSLYGDVYSQYGPGVYVLVGSVLRAIGVALTSDGARMFNLFLWLSSTLLVGLVLLRLTRGFLVAAAGLIVGFLVLSVDANEPLHPGATIGFLLIALVAAAVFFLPKRERTAMALVGAIAAALLSIKVNVGVFALVSIAFACTVAVPALRDRWAIRTLSAAILVAIPIILISGHLGEDWAQRFAGIVAIGTLSLALISTSLPPGPVPSLRGVGMVAVGALAVLALVSLVTILGGTTPSQLVHGWLIRPAHTPDVQFAPLLIDSRAWWWVFLGWVGAIATVGIAGRSLGSGAHLAIGTARVVAGLLIWVSLVGPIFDLPVELTQSMVVGAPLLWIAAIAPNRQDPRDTFLRVLIPALAALQFLHAYPMPGSQLGWSSFLLVLVGGICVADGLEELAGVGMSWRPSFAGWRAATSIVVVVFGAWLCLKPLRTEARLAKANYDAGVSLGLPGARKMHVSEPLYEQLQDLVGALRGNCNTFLTLPGMNSLNIFSGKEPPVEMSGPWPFFFTVAEQRDIVEDVRRVPRFCIVRKPDLLQFWAGFSDNTVPQKPLIRFIGQKFVLMHDFSGYELLVRRPA